MRTATIDRPIEPDPLGDALIDAAAGGAIEAAGTAAEGFVVRTTVKSALGAETAETVAPSGAALAGTAAKSAAFDLAKTAVIEGAKASAEALPSEDASPVNAPTRSEAPTPRTATPPPSVGRSTARGTSEEVNDSNACTDPAPYVPSPLLVRG